MDNYRLYTFCNFYLSQVQQGIQSLHVTSELFVKYRGNGGKVSSLNHNGNPILWDWATNDKTVIVLNGGNNASLKSTYDRICELNLCHSLNAKEKVQLPFVNFHEDEQSLGGIMTAVGIVVPHQFYDVRPKVQDENKVGVDNGDDYYLSNRTFDVWYQGTPEYEFIAMLKNHKLA